MSEPSYTYILKEGLWVNNPGLVQLLGLCPLLAVTTNAINGLGLGLATLLTLVASNVTVSLIRNIVRPEVRIPVFVLVIASIVTIIELAMNAWLHDLYLILGIFIPLIVTSVARNPLHPDSLWTGPCWTDWQWASASPCCWLHWAVCVNSSGKAPCCHRRT